MPDVKYLLQRTGDLSKSSSITWTLEGDLLSADLASGQPTSGIVSWDAGESGDKTLTIRTKGNTAVGPDKACRVRLSNPVGATIGTATATTTIVDDDSNQGVDILPTWDQSVFRTDTGFLFNAASRSQLDDIVSNCPDRSTIRLTGQGVNYGEKTFGDSKRLHIVSVYPVLGSIYCPMTNDPSIRKTSARSAEARNRFIRNIRPNNQRTHLRPTVVNGCGDIKFTGISMGFNVNDDFASNGSGGQINLSSRSRIWLDNYFVGSAHNRQFNVPTIYDAVPVEQFVFSRGWHFADGTYSGGGGPNNNSDYGWQLYNCNSFIAQDILVEGGHGHTLSPRFRSGLRDGIRLNRMCFAPWSNRPGNSGGGSWSVHINGGQMGDQSDRGDYTCGFYTMTEITFLDNAGISQDNQHYVGFRLANCRGAKLERCAFYELSRYIIHCFHKDPNSAGDQIARGQEAWDLGLEINDCIMRSASMIYVQDPGPGYAPLVIRASNNTVTGNGGVVIISGRNNVSQIIRGPNSGFPA